MGTHDGPGAGTLRVLAVIASFGEKNLPYLKEIVGRYGAMDLAVDVVIVSEAAKDVGPDVEVVVGLPSSNPWSLPFAHKQIFADRRDRYDLFIYAEDDIGVTERNIRAFLEATATLGDDEIAGFLRYEQDASGSMWMPDAHGVFHWRPASVCTRGGHVFAEYSNEHAACYMLTRDQLDRAIASGGFLLEPYEGKYDMLCAAATDPYTRCGFRKLVCVTDLAAFLLHHMSNRYAGQIGLPLSAFTEQVETLQRIAAGTHPATTLCEVESRLARTEFCKSFYEPPDEDILSAVPVSAATVLSIGSGWGVTESRLKARGAEVTALPLNSVIGTEAARAGVTSVYGSLDECLDRLSGQAYDCVLITNLLHLQSDPQRLFERAARLIGPGGLFIAECPNFDRLQILAKRLVGSSDFRKLGRFADGGVEPIGPGRLRGWARRAGLRVTALRWRKHALPSAIGGLRLPLGRLTAENWLFCARRHPKTVSEWTAVRRPREVGGPPSALSGALNLRDL